MTPGPWICDDGDSDVLGVFDKATGQRICYLSENALRSDGNRPPEEDAANAKAIAALPDIVFALKSVLNILPNGLGVTDAFKALGEHALEKGGLLTDDATRNRRP